MEHLSQSVLSLNEELAQTQRDLIKANRTLKRNEKKITQLMLTDPLTDIANRRHFDQKMAEELQRYRRYHQPVCLVIADIDNFKQVNDQYGHDVGDIVIQRFAHTMRDSKRSTDFVARVGGEEFILLLPNTESSQAYVFVDRIRMLFTKEHYDRIEKVISASFGIAQVKHDDTSDSLLKRADLGLYRAKDAGRNTVMIQDTDM